MAADVPEGFPLHLFSSPRWRGWVLALGDELASLDLVPVRNRAERRAVIVGRGRPRRERNARSAPHVVAAPDRLPFRDGSAAEVVLHRESETSSREVRRLVREGGRILELARVTHTSGTTPEHGAVPTPPASGALAASERQRTFVLWPLHGGAFLVTRSPAPDPWPFGSLHLGRPSAALSAAYAWLSRHGPRWIPGRVLLVIRSQSEIVTLAEERAGLGTPGSFGMVVKPGRNAILLAANEGRSEAREGERGARVVKFPLSELMVERTRRGLAVLDRLRETHGPRVTDRLARAFEADFEAPQPWSVEELIPGRTASRGWWIPGHYRRVAERSLDFVIELHRQGAARQELTPEALDGRLSPPLQALAAVCREGVADGYGANVGRAFPADELREAFQARLAGREVPLVRAHGDLWPANLLLDGRGELAGVLDWDQSREDAWPLLDVLHLLAVRHRRLAGRWFAGLVRWRLLPHRLARWERRLVGRYMVALDLPQGLWTPLVVLYWLELAAWRAEAFRGRPLRASWVDRNVREAAPHMLRALSRSP